jgi:hypothetical protein
MGLDIVVHTQIAWLIFARVVDGVKLFGVHHRLKENREDLRVGFGRPAPEGIERGEDNEPAKEAAE